MCRRVADLFGCDERSVVFCYCGGWVDSSRHVISLCPSAFSLEMGASQLLSDGDSNVRAPYWREYVSSDEADYRCCLLGIVEQEVCFFVGGWCMEHDC